ncbi:MAG: hypothetical protein FWC42_07525, partial [Proteobacteria bacterium]|nr:hypothetical protein [Pseudomonadota bacterium]
MQALFSTRPFSFLAHVRGVLRELRSMPTSGASRERSFFDLFKKGASVADGVRLPNDGTLCATRPVRGMSAFAPYGLRASLQRISLALAFALPLGLAGQQAWAQTQTYTVPAGTQAVL